MRWQLARLHLNDIRLVALVLVITVAAVVDPEWVGPAFLLMQVMVVPIVHTAHGSVRERILPLHARVLCEARLFAACIAVAVPIVAWGVSARLQVPHVISLAHVLSALCICVMCMTAVYLTTSGASAGTLRLSVQATHTALVAALLGLSALALYALPPFITLAAIATGTAALYLMLARNIPANLPVIAEERERKNSDRPATSRSPEWNLLVRSTLHWSVLFILPVVAASGYYGFFHSMLLVPLVVTIPQLGRTRLRWLSALPVSTAKRTALTHGPIVAISVIVFAAGQIAGYSERATRYSELTWNGQSTDTPGEWRSSPKRVSMVHWRVTESHTQPMIAAPWGEAVAADTISLFGVTRYNPFTSRESSTERFVDWQFTRASEAAFGTSFTQAQYDNLSLQDRPHVIAWQPRAIAFGYAAFVLQILLGLWFLELGGWHRLTKQRPVIIFLVPSLPADGVFVMLGAMIIAGDHINLGRYLSERFTLALLNLTPNSWPATVALIALCIAAAWRVLVWQFARSESGVV